YIVADSTMIGPDDEKYYSEKIVRLPNSFFPYDNRTEVFDAPNREQAGLPEAGFVFCCFNQNTKIIPIIFDIWMRLLGQVEESVLWLSKPTDETQKNLRKEAEARGVRADRLIFAERLPSMGNHLARYKLADVFLDTQPYGAHTTACDA